jgi:hypothetical protein
MGSGSTTIAKHGNRSPPQFAGLPHRVRAAQSVQAPRSGAFFAPISIPVAEADHKLLGEKHAYE